MRLPDDGELYLEVAEDYAELLAGPGHTEKTLHAVQVKDTRESGSVTLNSQEVLTTLKSLFSLQEENAGKQVFVTFLSTSPIGKEKLTPLMSGVPALEAWTLAKNGNHSVVELLEALRTRITEGELGKFLTSCSEEDFRHRLLNRITFACGAPSWDALEEEGREFLVANRLLVRAEAISASNSYDALMGHLFRVVLRSGSRMLDRDAFISAFQSATAVSVPSQHYIDLSDAAMRAGPEVAAERPDNLAINEALLVKVARQLCNVGRPPSITALFPEASSGVRLALESLSKAERWATDNNSLDKRNPRRVRISELVIHSELHHLVYATPGAGKSHTFFRLAEFLLEAAERQVLETESSETDERADPSSVKSTQPIPLLLPIGGMKTANDVLNQLSDLLPTGSAVSALRNPRVCVLLDGWSEYAVGDPSQRTELLRILSDVKVIACARHADENDSTFKCWVLERLAPHDIRHTVAQAFGDAKRLDDALMGLLQLPLMLSLYLLLGGAASTPGELIAYFHRHVSKGLPEQYSGLLSDAVSLISLRKDRSYLKLEAALVKHAGSYKVDNPLHLLHSLGTITRRGNLAIPVHDLYWSWLSGVGTLRGSRLWQAIGQLDSRESLNLALQSGETAESEDIPSVADVDAVLAIGLDASLGMPSMNSALVAKLDAMFTHPNLAVRCRAAVAGMRSNKASFVRKALEVIRETSKLKLYVAAFSAAIDVSILFSHKEVLATWLGAEGTDTVLDEIAARGDENWLPWIERMYRLGRIEPKRAVACTLACGTRVPQWTMPYLKPLAEESAWLLRFVSDRRANKEFALWVAQNYPNGGENLSGGWWHLNKVLLSCGDDNVYATLLACFPEMETRAQHLVGMAVKEMSEPWIGRFQRVAFAAEGHTHHNGLRDLVSLDIDDVTARDWIARGYYEQGWRVLIARHGNDVLPELIAELPDSFGGHQHLPALEAISFFEDLPSEILDEVSRRLYNPTTQSLGISPKVGETIIFVAAQVQSVGVPWLVRQYLSGFRLGAYHGRLLLERYLTWSKQTGIRLGAATPVSNAPFEVRFARQFVDNWEKHFSAQVLKLVPEVAIEAVLQPFADDDEKAAQILEAVGSLQQFDQRLLDRMMASSTLMPLIPKVFGNVINELPPEQLLIFAKSGALNIDRLLHDLRSASDPSFYETHLELLNVVVSSPLNLHNVRYVANMFRNYATDVLLIHLEQLLSAPRKEHLSDNLQWLLREIGEIRRELLVNEDGLLLRS
ncbi:hypothetical protein SAMN05216345_10338 [Cupriavidus sp. YR651]|nr:hypothetical protein SAMN05216345_10338 [Cupriavidus sp. YR651]